MKVTPLIRLQLSEYLVMSADTYTIHITHPRSFGKRKTIFKGFKAQKINNSGIHETPDVWRNWRNNFLVIRLIMIDNKLLNYDDGKYSINCNCNFHLYF
jgi:hypothetical protein